MLGEDSANLGRMAMQAANVHVINLHWKALVKELLRTTEKVLNRAVMATGTISALLTIVAIGIVMALFEHTPIWLAASFLGLFGLAEVLQRNAKASLEQRLHTREPDVRFFDAALQCNGKSDVCVVKQFRYGGLFFNVLSLEHVKAPMALAGPLCPRCRGHLAERRKVSFPFRHQITHVCACGFTQHSTHTLGELEKEARKMSGLID
ncbi:hypothetical protein [Paludibacterium denitrificans]|uniref:Uncharacterized protein n=1 Tax=Paludibacterium denitrificans TaxID=2675226 RepID=A0A844GA98_9NEIS|nr:hypothetical protein [Paludibacterium denitrificans]MTD32549.1 hypothetical protein [Paludibacterium denitrificans]